MARRKKTEPTESERWLRPYVPRIRAFGAPEADKAAHIFVSGGEAERPEDVRIQAQMQWGAEYLGLQSYSFLTGYAYFALPQRLESLHQLGSEADRIIALGEPPTWASRERLHMIQWLAASQVCMMIEELAALTTAVGRWRNEQTDIASTYLEWQGDIAATIGNAAWTDRTFWTRLIGYPGHTALRDLGMTAAEAAAFEAAVEATLDTVMLGLEWARTFFTEEMRRVYARFKHGFSLVSPLSTPVAIDTHLAPAAAQSILGGSLLILDKQRKRPPRLFAMRSSGYDLSKIGQAGSLIASTVQFVAASIVESARSDVRRGITLLTHEFVPLGELEQRASEVYIGVERGSGYYRMNTQTDVIRLQRDLTQAAERHRLPLPLPAPPGRRGS